VFPEGHRLAPRTRLEGDTPMGIMEQVTMTDSLRGRTTPLHMDADAFRRAGHRLVDDLADLWDTIGERPVAPGKTLDEIREAMGSQAGLPEEGMDPEALLAETTRLLIDNSTFNGHPRFFGYITAGPAPIGVLGDFLASGINPNVGGWSLSPGASEIELQAIRWISELVGFPTSGRGILTSGGQVANMLGFWAARAAIADWPVAERGMAGEGSLPLRVYTSAGTHHWLRKVVDLAGLGTDSVRWIPTDARHRMDIRVLRSRIEEDVAAGARPFFVVGTAGSVGTGAVDQLPEIRSLCDEFGMWMHVDGAYGAFAAAASSAPDDLRALSSADSVALDPHKWLYAPLEAGCTLVRDPEALPRAFSYNPDYFHMSSEVTNFYEHGIQNSRGFRALKVWLSLRQAGRQGFRQMLDDDIELARRFHGIAAEHEELEAFTQGLSITTYRYVPRDLRARVGEAEVETYLSALNEAVLGRLEREGRAFVSNAVLGERYLLRMCIVNFRTGQEDIEALAEISAEAGRAVDAELRPGPLR